MKKEIEEILEYFIPQQTFESKSRVSFKWESRTGNLEVLIPGHKHGDNENKKAQIVIGTRKPPHSPGRITSTHEYDITLLKYLLNVLNRPH